MSEGEWKKTGCILCSLNCGLEVQTGGEGGREITRVRGDKEHPESRGYLCEKPQRLNYYQNAKDRLTSPLRRREDGSFEEVSWDVAISEIAARFRDIKARHGGDKILFYGGGGQGNHLGGTYGDATLKALGVKYKSNALAQEKTGEFWVNGKMFGVGVHGDFHHAEVSVFIGKNPWQSHGFARARAVIKEIVKDPARKIVVIDPRVSETAAKADIHLRLKPGTDAWCLLALAAIIAQEGLVDEAFVEEHTEGYELIGPILRDANIAHCAGVCGVPEAQLRETARLIADAGSVSVFEDLGMQMNRHSTLGSYLQRLTWTLTGNFGKRGANNVFVPFFGLNNVAKGIPIGKKKRPSGPPKKRKSKVSPVTGSKIIIGLIPCNVMAEEILADHPDRFRAMFIESGNPAHSVADSALFREAMQALEFSVVIDVAMTETARLAHYVLPAASQFEKAETTFFNIEVPENTFHLRHRLFEPLEGTLPEAEIHARLVTELADIPPSVFTGLRAAAKVGNAALGAALGALIAARPRYFDYLSVLLYRSLGEELPAEAKEAAVLWALTHLYTMSEPTAREGAGYGGPAPLAGERLFRDIVSNRSGVVFAKMRDYAESWERVGTRGGRIQLALPELFAAIAKLSYETPARDADYPLYLSAGERRSETTNTIIRDPDARVKKSRGLALRISPEDAERAGVEAGGVARVVTRRGSCEVSVDVTDAMSPGHISLPNGYGLDYTADGDTSRLGVSTNELTHSADRDPIAGTPWHKSVPARVERVA